MRRALAFQQAGWPQTRPRVDDTRGRSAKMFTGALGRLVDRLYAGPPYPPFSDSVYIAEASRRMTAD